MNKRYQVLITVLMILLISLACTITIGGPEAASVNMGQQPAAQQPAVIQQPTSTEVTIPTPTQVGPPTSIPNPCNKATFISETVPDGTQYLANKSFTKIWRFRNDGTCTWNTNYQLVFNGGDQMSGPGVKNFTQNVAPGEKVDISVGLKSPSNVGTYTGYWKLRADNGEFFINNFSVSIQVKPLQFQVIPTLELKKVPTLQFQVMPTLDWQIQP